MAVSFGSSTSSAETAAANTTYTAPSSIVDGDLLLIWHYEFANSPTAPEVTAPATPPAGFSAVPGTTWPQAQAASDNVKTAQWFWYKIASGESGNYTVTHNSIIKRGIMARATGNDTSNPFAPNPTFNKGTVTTTTFLGLTTTVDSCLIMAFGSDDNDNAANLTPPTGSTPTFTERVDIGGEYLATGILSPAGATGDKTMTNNSLTTYPFLASLVSVQSPAVQPPGHLVRFPLGV
jgi:hypothetical protein